jgi:hypothetical protein
VRRPIGVGHVFGQCDRITVENEGGGIARDVNFVVISGPLIYAGGLPPTGMLAPGKRSVLDSNNPPGPANHPVTQSSPAGGVPV